MNILPYTIANTNDLLTGRGGLVCLAELMRRIGFSSWVARYFPKPGSNRGYAPAEVVTLWMLKRHISMGFYSGPIYLTEVSGNCRWFLLICQANHKCI